MKQLACLFLYFNGVAEYVPFTEGIFVANFIHSLLSISSIFQQSVNNDYCSHSFIDMCVPAKWVELAICIDINAGLPPGKPRRLESLL